MKDAERIRDFILEHRPHVVMVGTTNLHCKQLHADLRSILDHILEHHPQFITRSETGDVDIVYADETLAALWQTSAAAQQEMGDQPPLVRRAVSHITMSGSYGSYPGQFSGKPFRRQCQCAVAK